MADPRTTYAETLLDVANDAAQAASTRFLTFLTVGVYIAITIAATTDEMLVKGSTVTLPLLNTQIPISGSFGFYTVAPWLIVLLHLDLLLQLSALSRRLARFAETAEQLPEDDRARLHARVINLYSVESTAGMDSGALQRLSRLIIWFGVILLPLVLLLGTQIRFLPFHSDGFTWMHRFALVTDVVLVLLLWPQLATKDRRSKVDASGSRTLPRKLLAVPPVVAVVCVASLVVSLGFATIPRDRSGMNPCDEGSRSDADQTRVGWLSRARKVWFETRNLNLREQVLTTNGLSPKVINTLRDGTAEEREKVLVEVSDLNFLQGRDLRYANLFHAVLPRLDLRSRNENGRVVPTRLSGADLSWTQMQRVLLDQADLDDAKLVGAQLQGAVLSSARLRHADLSSAQMEDAKLGAALLDCARISGANLRGADLGGARLQDADLSGARLEGANLRKASLQGANLSGAMLQGADLTDANLERANLRGAQLQAAMMRGTSIWGADFEDANLDLMDDLPVGHLEVLQSARFGQCLKEQAAVFPKCTSTQTPEEHLRSVAAYLVELACSDPYVGKSLARSAQQSLQGTESDKRSLAVALALTDGSPSSKCHNVELLPADVTDDLKRLTKRKSPSGSSGTASALAVGS
jgi:uncharacterized protein YjbI with pentapeptide repeats